MTLSTLAVGIGLFYAAAHAFALARPKQFAQAARKFPRSEAWGYALMTLGTVWFLSNLAQETIADFAPYKNLMLLGFGAVGLLTCIFVRDFLAVRGLALVLLLLAKLTLDTARWHDSQWRLVLATWAYVWIIAGMWFTISPWRLRDLIQWQTDSDARLRMGSTLRLGLGLLVALLGLTALR
jgi:hypothetical protein